MLSKIFSASILGIEAKPVIVEIDISQGLPGLNIVGLADTTVKEARERIKAAIINSDLGFPRGKITINLAPANIKKKGSHFDLAMAIGILSASNKIETLGIDTYGFIGELSLDGSINIVKGLLPMVIALRDRGINNIIIPRGNKEEAVLVQGINLILADNLKQVVDHFNRAKLLTPYIKEGKFNRQALSRDENLDFKDVKGQEVAKRVISIAVAGNHGLLMTGSPGTGKTMMAERIPSVMPEMNYDEIIETTIIYSVAGQLTKENPYITQRPFRKPHHRITPAGLIGGGSDPKPGEISLANKGVLFLDEVGEFGAGLIDMLRVPLEKKEISLFRKGDNFIYPADFLLVAATNPCKCGYYGDPTHKCKCKDYEIDKYKARLSGPILDRIDLHMTLQPITYDGLESIDSMSSADMRKQIEKTIKIQEERYARLPIKYNSQLDNGNIEEACLMGRDEKKLLQNAFNKLNLNPRTLFKTVKIARTIADMEESETVGCQHIAEALQYRSSLEYDKR